MDSQPPGEDAVRWPMSVFQRFNSSPQQLKLCSTPPSSVCPVNSFTWIIQTCIKLRLLSVRLLTDFVKPKFLLLCLLEFKLTSPMIELDGLHIYSNVPIADCQNSRW